MHNNKKTILDYCLYMNTNNFVHNCLFFVYTRRVFIFLSGLLCTKSKVFFKATCFGLMSQAKTSSPSTGYNRHSVSNDEDKNIQDTSNPGDFTYIYTCYVFNSSNRGINKVLHTITRLLLVSLDSCCLLLMQMYAVSAVNLCHRASRRSRP